METKVKTGAQVRKTSALVNNKNLRDAAANPVNAVSQRVKTGIASEAQIVEGRFSSLKTEFLTTGFNHP